MAVAATLGVDSRSRVKVAMLSLAYLISLPAVKQSKCSDSTVFAADLLLSSLAVASLAAATSNPRSASQAVILASSHLQRSST